MRARHRLVATVALSGALTVLAACGSSGSSDSAATTVTTTAPATTAASTTTTLPATVGTPTAEETAKALYAAWNADDRVAAARVAEPTAIDAIWKAVKGSYEFYSACDSGEFGTGGCLYRDRATGQTIQIDMEKRGENWVAVGAFYSAE
jgi:hypothetical protein